MPFSKMEVEHGLITKGFIKKNTAHKVFRYIAQDGTETPIYTRISHGRSGGDIPDPLLTTMAKQCRLTLQEFKGLVNCPFTTEHYEVALQEQGFLPPPPP